MIVLAPNSGLFVSVIQIVAIPLGILSLQIFFSSYFLGNVDTAKRTVFGITALLFFATVFSKSVIFLGAAAALFVICVVGQIMKRGRVKTADATQGAV